MQRLVPVCRQLFHARKPLGKPLARPGERLFRIDPQLPGHADQRKQGVSQLVLCRLYVLPVDCLLYTSYPSPLSLASHSPTTAPEML